MAPPLPTPNDEALAHSRQLVELICNEIKAAGGWVDFARYMHLALYTPGRGYYSGGASKFGAAGDFVTAPEVSTLFGQTLARQAVQVMRETQGDILELGAGTGKLCAQILSELQKLQALPKRYLILEVSAQLRELQRQNLQELLPEKLAERVQWLDVLPLGFTGLVLANEVLDALPMHIIQADEEELRQLGVRCKDGALIWDSQKISVGKLQERVARLNLPPGYRTEICPAMDGLIASLGNMLHQGVLLFIDYGFPRHEYYHAHRREGTLMCHYRHYAHGDPFLYPGLQDITAHVDFTAAAEAGVANGLQLLGYCSQTQFLINCGITELLQQHMQDMTTYTRMASEAQKLLSPAEMGELFKVIVLGKGYTGTLAGFAQGDKRHRL